MDSRGYHPGSIGLVAESIRDGIQQSLDTLRETISVGFGGLANSLALEVRLFPEKWKGLSDANVITDLLSTVKSPEVKQLLSEGKVEGAIAALDHIYIRDQTRTDEELAVLLLSKDEKDWNKALSIITEQDIREPKYFLTLAYRFWSAGQLPRAIEMGEKGLRWAKENDPAMVPKFTNSLAYYYADGDKPEHEAIARQYAREARVAQPDEIKAMDTEAFVLVSYGKTREEILQGVKLAEQARDNSGVIPFEAFAKTITKANRRIQTLER